MLNGFKTFLTRGNVVDMAVGVIIGGAFAKIVDAIVNGFLNPLIGGIFGDMNFDKALSFQFNGATVSVGVIITALVNFLIVAAALYFFVVIPMNKLAGEKAQEESAAKPTPQDEELAVLTEIRDLLQTRS